MGVSDGGVDFLVWEGGCLWEERRGGTGYGSEGDEEKSRRVEWSVGFKRVVCGLVPCGSTAHESTRPRCPRWNVGGTWKESLRRRI